MAWAGLVVVRLARSKQDWGGRLVWISRDGQVQESQRSPLGQKETDTLALNWSRLVRRLVPAGDGKPGPATDGLCLPVPQTRREARLSGLLKIFCLIRPLWSCLDLPDFLIQDFFLFGRSGILGG